HIDLPEFYEFAWYQRGPEDFGRTAVQAKLEAIPGKHLVVVRYRPEHEPFAEWIYNDPDIDQSKIVWAHEMGPENQELLDYFKDPRVWLVQADEKPHKLSPYPSQGALTGKPSGPGS